MPFCSPSRHHSYSPWLQWGAWCVSKMVYGLWWPRGGGLGRRKWASKIALLFSLYCQKINQKLWIRRLVFYLLLNNYAWLGSLVNGTSTATNLTIFVRNKNLLSTMAGDSVVVKTRKFTKNPLLSRRQVRLYCEHSQLSVHFIFACHSRFDLTTSSLFFMHHRWSLISSTPAEPT